MSMPEKNPTMRGAIPQFLALIMIMGLTTTGRAESPNLGRQVDAGEITRWNMNVFPDGRGLPSGSGNAQEGAEIYQQKCQACHGPSGSGGSADELAGTRHPLTDPNPDKAIGNYWPYATTLFDFIRRAMPLDAPGSLSDHQVYALTAYLLRLNEVIDDETLRLDAVSLPRVNMPNRDGFVRIDAK